MKSLIADMGTVDILFGGYCSTLKVTGIDFEVERKPAGEQETHQW